MYVNINLWWDWVWVRRLSLEESKLEFVHKETREKENYPVELTIHIYDESMTIDKNESRSAVPNLRMLARRDVSG
jgi:hypothetical protein